MAQKKYKQYDNIAKALKKDGFSKYCSLGRYLMDAFIIGERKITASEVYKKKFCEEKQFRAWRKKLCDDGWLRFEIINHQLSTIKYNPGYKLRDFINKEKTTNHELVTRNELDSEIGQLETKIEEQNEKIAEQNRKMDTLFSKIINAVDYPYEGCEKEKTDKYFNGEYDDAFRFLTLYNKFKNNPDMKKYFLS